MLSIGSRKKLGLAPIASEPNFTEKAYAALKDVITRMDLYGSRAEIRLDERQLASDLGVSRTPVREALAQLEREGFVRSVPRRGIYVVRKTRREVIELITAWAALEGMAAGMDAVITKPINLPVLLAEIAAVLAKTELTRTQPAAQS
jgi:DNA-binding GntR family transcriptional regulator